MTVHMKAHSVYLPHVTGYMASHRYAETETENSVCTSLLSVFIEFGHTFLFSNNRLYQMKQAEFRRWHWC